MKIYFQKWLVIFELNHLKLLVIRNRKRDVYVSCLSMLMQSFSKNMHMHG